MGSSVLDAHSSSPAKGSELGYEPSPRNPKKPDRSTSRPALRFALRSRLALAPFEGWLVLVLLAAALYCVVSSVIAANWVDNSNFLLWSPTVGLLIGLIVAKSPRFPQAILHIAACLLGYWLAMWLTSSVAFHIPMTQLLMSLKSAITGHISTEPATLGQSIFFFYLAFLCFFLGYFGSWLIYRAHLPWLVALVYCSILLVNLNYVRDQGLSVELALALSGSLVLLIARMRLVTQIVQWTQEGLYTEHVWLSTMTRRCMQAASGLVVVTLLLSWLIPAQGQIQSGKVFWDGLDNAVTNISNGHLSLQSPGSVFQPYQPPTNFFGDQLTISGTVNLPAGDVLSYTPSDHLPHYLEGYTYNQFDGHTWTISSPFVNYAYNSSDVLPLDSNKDNYTQTSVVVKMINPPSGNRPYLFAPAQPKTFNVPVFVYSDVTATAWIQQGPLTKDEAYQVVSLLPPSNAQNFADIPLPKINQALWSADVNYAKIALYYTEPPKDLSPNVLAMARKWTQGATSAYDALKMLESHLSNQQEFTYRVTNPAIPPNVDVADWLLEQRVGYCTYYASTMAVMGRLLGLPMRIVNGFSAGHLDQHNNIWVVQGNDAHSWVQAYLPNYGWISFDPTPGFSPNATPSAKQSISPLAAPPPARITPKPTPHVAQTAPAVMKPPPAVAPASNQPLINQNVLTALSIGSLLLSIGILLAAIFTYWWRNLYANYSFVAGMFWRFCHIAGWVGLAPRSWQTPYEYSRMLASHFPQRAKSLWHLTDLFVRERWGMPYNAPHPLEEKNLEQSWPALRGCIAGYLLKRRNRLQRP